MSQYDPNSKVDCTHTKSDPGKDKHSVVKDVAKDVPSGKSNIDPK